jgi:hypothetical protein
LLLFSIFVAGATCSRCVVACPHERLSCLYYQCFSLRWILQAINKTIFIWGELQNRQVRQRANLLSSAILWVVNLRSPALHWFVPCAENYGRECDYSYSCEYDCDYGVTRPLCTSSEYVFGYNVGVGFFWRYSMIPTPILLLQFSGALIVPTTHISHLLWRFRMHWQQNCGAYL